MKERRISRADLSLLFPLHFSLKNMILEVNLLYHAVLKKQANGEKNPRKEHHMSIQPLRQERSLKKNGTMWWIDITGRVLLVAIGFTIVSLLISLLTGSKPTLSPTYLQKVLYYLVTGAVYAPVLLPLARRLPYRQRVRILALFIPLFWTATMADIAEAYFFTTFSPIALTIGAIILGLTQLVTCGLISWLFPAYEQEQAVPGIWQILRQRPLLSWIWRMIIVGLAYPVFYLYVFGALITPFVAKYYHDPTYMAQSHTISQPDYIVWPLETMRGMLFALSLLPVLAVMRGRHWPKILYTALYLSLIGAAFESWLPMLGQASWPLALRIAHGLELTGDALSRGIFIALFLVLPIMINKPGSVNEPRTETGTDS
jgi:hypothetical protein